MPGDTDLVFSVWGLFHHKLARPLLTVSLDELYPLAAQATACFDLQATAVALDLLRFFYKVRAV